MLFLFLHKLSLVTYVRVDTMLRRKSIIIYLLILSLLFSIIPTTYATNQNTSEKRMELYKQLEYLTHVPWYYIAAVDQYERNLRASRKDLPDPEGFSGIYFQPDKWVGELNPNKEDDNVLSITFFNGIGKDGDGDGKASLHSDMDVLYTLANYLSSYGSEEDAIRIALWDYYQRDKSVKMIMEYSKIFKTYQTIQLEQRHFPISKYSNYTYKNTWGAARGFGGRRSHEGTDIFANYGVNVLSTCYGVVELKGWNRFGGWRIGIRDINNNYHYFAHLNGFAKDIEIGSIVEPGTVIGTVGSSGYGPPGTSGKFPPHLHYGIYKDNGISEWSYDPYPHLKRWEKEMRSKK